MYIYFNAVFIGTFSVLENALSTLNFVFVFNKLCLFEYLLFLKV